MGKGAYFPPMSTATQACGEVGEQVAERWLRQQGWRILKRPFRIGHRDIDLVIERDSTIGRVGLHE
jgi:Holliday junction resolvase-like predicted endonuclease